MLTSVWRVVFQTGGAEGKSSRSREGGFSAMSRRKQADMDFGSDSFLDIIANIVGILIILIVIAGVRVSQEAINVESSGTESESDSQVAALSSEPDPKQQIREPGFLPPVPTPPRKPSPEPELTNAVPLDPAVTAKILAASEPEKAPPPKPKPRPVMPAYVPETPKPVPPSPELQQSIAELKKELDSLNQRSGQADASAKRYSEWSSELTKQIADARQTLQDGWDQATEQQKELRELERSFQRTKLVFIGKKKELSRAENQQAQKETLRHEFTPVSRVVDGKEIHFHVKDNRVAYVPLMELVERMKPQLRRQKDWLLKYREHKGRVGPHRGFLLDYVVVRKKLSALESARNGGAARIVPILLKFEPVEELTRETLDRALRPGSVFIREMQMADVNTTLTFWVYPDSYGMYRQLKKFAHAEGFTVAARPLEEGEVIKASPWGSKSAGQ